MIHVSPMITVSVTADFIHCLHRCMGIYKAITAVTKSFNNKILNIKIYRGVVYIFDAVSFPLKEFLLGMHHVIMLFTFLYILT